MKIETRINFGDKVEDTITGFGGIVVGFACYIIGCNQFLITPKCKDNKKVDGEWFDEGRLKQIENTKIKEKDVKGKTNGCDMEAPKK